LQGERFGTAGEILAAALHHEGNARPASAHADRAPSA
jgi:hypothetical protein